jgi:cobalt-precorrin 5A hydrolase/precorrin-3B C17-methyltransferase
VHALAAHLEVPARFLAANRLRAETARLLSPSAAAHAATGTWGVAEGAALAAVGADGALVVGKRVAGRCTVALARAPAPVDPADVGQARGRLAIVGLGPGGPAWRTAEAERLLAEASDLVGYSLYLDLAGPLPGQVRHDYPIGSEEERCVAALDLAATGQSVALLGSGDAGIYGLATLVFELLGRSQERVGWQRVEIVVSPGVSALQLAAARVGAPLNHDFCAISLSDLLTPWAAIERRLVAAAEGDFVVALYNPVSSRRREALPQARAILLRNRPPETPVVIARNLGRAGETVVPITLAELEPASVDMLSLVLVGSTATRRTPRLHGPDWIYTPRGYRLG